MNIAKNLERARIFYPDNIAILFEGEAITYRQLDEASSRLANSLRELGLAAGDRVAIFLPNIPAFATAYFAVQKLGAIATSLSSLLKSQEVAYIVNDSEAKALFTTAALRENVPAEELPTLDRVIIAEGEAGGDDLAIADLIAAGSPAFDIVDRDRHDAAAILYTSGTTGFPKGATLSHQNVVTNVYATVHHIGARPDDRLHLFLPLFHCFGQNFVLNSSVVACSTLVMHRRFVPDEVLEAIQRDRVTMFFAVPTVYIYLLNMDVSAYDLSSLRYCFTAAANMPPEIARLWQEKFGLTVYEGYGLTECSPFAAYNHDLRYKLGSIGAPIEGVEMKIVDPEGDEATIGSWGEILIKGPNIMLGYWNKPEATAQAITDGWLHSGDIGVMDEEGFFYIVDRVKDMIITGGFNVYPAEVEHVIYEHSAVKEAAVYGVSDPVKGEMVKAAIVLKEKATTTPEELIDYCRQHMAVYKAPRAVVFMEQLPKSATGKILKRVLREQDSG